MSANTIVPAIDPGALTRIGREASLVRDVRRPSESNPAPPVGTDHLETTAIAFGMMLHLIQASLSWFVAALGRPDRITERRWRRDQPTGWGRRRCDSNWLAFGRVVGEPDVRLQRGPGKFAVSPQVKVVHTRVVKI
jgi:hypothetical protein